MKTTERISLATACLSLALLACAIGMNVYLDIQGKRHIRAMQATLGMLPETVEVFCQPPGCPCQKPCLCCRCGRSD